MSEATIVAVIILVGVFLILMVTITREGVEAAIKMWNIMGALTGVAFGSITSFYFTKSASEQKIAQLGQINKELLEDAKTANDRLRTVASIIDIEGSKQPTISAEERGKIAGWSKEALDNVELIKKRYLELTEKPPEKSSF